LDYRYNDATNDVNISLVTETYTPEVNGVAMTLSQLVNHLRSRGHKVQVVRPRQKQESPGLQDNEKTVSVRGAPIPRYPDLRFGLPCGNRLRSSWRQFQPDIIHVATEGPLGLSAIRAAKRLSIPCTSTFHTNFHEYSKHYNAPLLMKGVLAYLRWIHNQTCCTMHPTQELADALEKSGFLNNQVFGRGVDLAAFHPGARDESLRSKWGAGSEDTIVLHVSRFAAEKNYELLFKSYRKILNTLPHARFVVVGDGPVRAKWERAFPEAIYTGVISLENRVELGQIYASSDVFLYPSNTETYGNVLTEAMASGNACLAFNYAAAAIHIEDGVNGLTVPMGDEEQFLERSLDLVKNVALQKRLGQSAADYAVEHLDWVPVVDQFESLLFQYADKPTDKSPNAQNRTNQ